MKKAKELKMKKDLEATHFKLEIKDEHYDEWMDKLK